MFGRTPPLNLESLEERVLLTAQPDLTVLSASLGSLTLVEGNQYQLPVTWTVKNQGAFAPSQNWTDGFYLSSKTTYDSSALFINGISRSDALPLAIGGAYTASTTLTIPASSLLGNQNILVVTDPGDTINESNTDNNAYSVAVQVAAPNVNLAVSNVSIASHQLVAGNGDTMSVSWTVTNTGTDTAKTSWSDGVYLSSKQAVDSTAVFLGSFVAPNTLAPNASYTQTQTVTIPNTTLIGSNENILIQANTYGDQGQNGTTNGTADIGNVAVTTPGNVDLEVVPGSVSTPSTGTAGQTIPISWTVKNIGAGPALASWFDAIYSSPTATYNSATAHFISSFSAASTLAAGASYTQSESVSLPGSSSGDSFILVEANSGNAFGQQAETNTANNFAASGSIPISEPSLSITAFNGPATANLGNVVTLTWSVKNTSTVATPISWSDSIYLSDASTYNSKTAQFVESFSAPIPGSLAAGASYDQSEQISLPYTQTGNRFLILVADATSASNLLQGAQPVSGTTPIVASSAIALGEPDLTVALNAPPTAAVLGQAFNLSWTVTNSGTVAATASWEDAVFISSSANFDPKTATLLTTINAPISLAAGASYTLGDTVKLPSMAAGSYHLFVVADRENDQGKTNESIDNIVLTPLSVTGPALTLQINSTPSAVVAGNGASASVSWTVTNSSSVDAVDPWYDAVYLSTSPTVNLNSSSSYWSLGTFSEPFNSQGYGAQGYLNAGSSYTNTQQVVIPTVPAAGTYYFVVEADSNYSSYQGDIQGQSVTTSANATASASVALTLPNVALAVVSATPSPTSVVAGNTVSLMWTVQNQGADTAGGSWYDEVYISSKQTLDKTATVIGTYYYDGSTTPLTPNATYTTTQSLTIPGNTAAGTEYLLIEPDESQGQAAATSVLATPVTVSIPNVELATAITSSPATATPGQSITVAWKVTNEGTATTSASYWDDEIYLSTKPTYDSSAIYLESYYVSTSGQLPLGPTAATPRIKRSISPNTTPI